MLNNKHKIIGTHAVNGITLKSFLDARLAWLCKYNHAHSFACDAIRCTNKFIDNNLIIRPVTCDESRYGCRYCYELFTLEDLAKHLYKCVKRNKTCWCKSHILFRFNKILWFFKRYIK